MLSRKGCKLISRPSHILSAVLGYHKIFVCRCWPILITWFNRGRTLSTDGIPEGVLSADSASLAN